MTLSRRTRSPHWKIPRPGTRIRPGPARRLSNRFGNRSAPYSVGKAPTSAWQHDMYASFPAPATRASAIETGTKLCISKLDYRVSNEDVKELFSEAGNLKRYLIHYDRSGRSKGTAVVFSRRGDALAAVKRYNNVLLDGKLEIVRTNTAMPTVVFHVSNGGCGELNDIFKSAPGSGSTGWPRGGDCGRWRGHGQGKGRNEPLSAAELDADLENMPPGLSGHLVTALEDQFIWLV